MSDWWEVKKWSDLQHYQGGKRTVVVPPWIKLYRRLLDDAEFRALTVHARDLLRDIWLIAAENKGRVPADPEKIAWRLRVASKTLVSPLRELLSAGFIEGSDASLAQCEQYASDGLAQKREDEKRRDKKEEARADARVITTTEEVAPDLFEHIPAAYHPAVVGALRAARDPAAVALSIRALNSGMHGRYSWDVIGRALADWQASGEPFKARTLDVFCGDLTRRRSADAPDGITPAERMRQSIGKAS